jgi:hypothetical protein
MAGDLILAPTRVLNADEAHHLGSLLAASGYFADARDAAQAAVKVMAGAELGLGPVASMRGVDIIKGEVSLGAGLVAALVRRSGRYDYEVKRWDDQGCVILFTRDGKALHPEVSFTHEDAVKAGLAGGDNYRKYPRNMYFARAMTNGARLHCPDIFAGSVYATGELDGEPVSAPDASVVETQAEPAAATEEPVGSATLDEAIARGEVEGLEKAVEPSHDRTIGEAAAEAAAPTEAPPAGEPATPSELARSYGIADATQRFILITVAGIEDANDLDAAYASLSQVQLEAVVAEWKKRAA